MLIFLMGFFYALNYHFAVFSKMMHIKDTVEVATCCANYGCLSRLHFCSMSEICGCFGELGKRGSPDKPGGLSIQLCKSEKKEFYIRYSS